MLGWAESVMNAHAERKSQLEVSQATVVFASIDTTDTLG